MISVVAIDDEPLALQLVAGYIEKTPDLSLSGQFDNPVDASEFLRENKVDLIFVDIQMPDLSGIEFTRLLEKGPKVIFTTAYEKYALEGYKLEIVDYLLKPFSYEEFLDAVRKARNLISLEQKAATRVEVNNEFLFLKSDYKIKRINFDDILYIEGLKDYVKVYTRSNPKPVLSLTTLKLLESKLPAGKFMRVHRSYIVNLGKIDTIERSRIVFDKTYIPVSDQYKDKFQEYLDKNFL
jgi:DNA-binding LytR/AlgR family response regulator